MTVTGRTLDADGRPVPGTGFEYEPTGVVADYLGRRLGPLASHPEQGIWQGMLPAGGDRDVSFSLVAAGYEGPIPHYHTTSTETFAVEQGTFAFTLDGETRRVEAGETVTVDPGTVHTFDCVGDELGLVETTIAPPGRISWMIPTLLGVAHDDEHDEGIWHAVTVWDELAEDTVFVDPPPALARPAVRLLRPLAAVRGYRGALAKYRQPSFWRDHVEQPEIPPRERHVRRGGGHAPND